MNTIDTRIAIGEITGTVGKGAKADSITLPVKDTQSAAHTQSKPVQTEMSFTSYGSRNEHLAVVVTNKETGKVIRKVPSEEMQRLHVHLEVMA